MLRLYYREVKNIKFMREKNYMCINLRIVYGDLKKE